MPRSLFWAVDVYGKVYSLYTARGRWQQCTENPLELKRVTAADMGCWAIGFDQEVYLNVLPSDVIIRHQEETFENQRWNPVDGYTDTLLPTDRWPWTDEFGTKPQPLHSFHLPSENWEWEGDWYVDDESCGRESTSTGGWEYAVDFPTTFTKEKKWNSCVRRRRWLRYRRYKALGLWAKVPLDKGQPPPEPFTDISCGGWDMGDRSEKPVSLWAVSQQGKVWFRSGIHQQNPEGTVWESIPIPESTEVAQISAGPGDLLWAVLWDGQLLVRTGIHKRCPKGASWVMVDPPNNTKAVHVAVGVSVVWAITKDKKVWFRRGVNSHNATGLGWICVSGDMMMISVGPRDQVWGVGSEDRSLYFRYGVTPTEVTGQAWVPVCAHVDNSHDTKKSNDVCLISAQIAAPTQGSVLGYENIHKPNAPNVPTDSVESALVSEHGSSLPKADQDRAEEVSVPCQSSGLQCSQPKCSELPWSNVDLAEMTAASAILAEKSVAVYPMELGEAIKQEERAAWAWITAGQCEIESNMHVSWLEVPDADPLSPSITPALSGAGVQCSIAAKTQQEKNDTAERSVSVKKVAMCWRRDWQPHQLEEVCVTLEQVRGGGAPHDDIVYLYYTHNQERKYLYAVIREVTALVSVHWESMYGLAIYTAQRTRQRWPILLTTESEQDMKSWLSLLNESCCESRALQGPPSKQALWAVTTKGDIMVHEPSPCLEAPAQYFPCEQMFWRQVPGHLYSVESNSLGVVWGIGYDRTAWVYTTISHGENQVQDDIVNQQTQNDIRNVYIYENQRWNPVTGYTNKGLPTDRYMWSDALGLKECTKERTKPPSPEWKWVTDWIIDYSSPGGTDKEGWQYAADFTVTFHGYKTMKDFVRRRRWLRKCKITLTGPWQKVPPIPLIDVTVLPCLAQSCLEQVPVWAISEKGDVLCRLGVSTENPAGSSWLHVGTDQPFKSISIGGGHQVWAIARDGAVFYRGSVSAQNPAGECWYHIPSPNRQTLRQVSVGRTSVYAVDETGNLWYRQGLTPSYPQGSAWELICGNVCKVSVGPLDQVWIIADKVPGHPEEKSGTVCHRLGVRPMQPKGLSWDFGIGGGWEHLSVRGNSTEPQRIISPSPQSSRNQEQVNSNAARV